MTGRYNRNELVITGTECTRKKSIKTRDGPEMDIPEPLIVVYHNRPPSGNRVRMVC
jgi:hypothetical protein